MRIEQGMVAVVTGAGSGMGRSFALHAARRGMRVVAADIEQPMLDDTVAAVGQVGAECIGVRTDVSLEADVQQLADVAFAEFGAVNLLFNNAGVFMGGLMWERTAADWDWVMSVNVTGIAHAVRAFVPCMLESGQPGHIVNTASIGGVTTGAYSGPYITSKFAVVGLTECLARDLLTTGKDVAASVLLPSAIDTGIARSKRNRPERWIDRNVEPGADAQFVEDTLAATTEMGISPDEVADIVFDAVEAGRYFIPTKPSYHDQIRERHEDMQDLVLPRSPQID